MTITATFKQNIPVRVEPKRKNGRVTYDWQCVQVVDTLHPIIVKHGSKLYNLYLRGRDVESKERFPFLYHHDGSIAKGIWRHGWTGGKAHEEPLEYSGTLKKLIEVTNYQNGRVKDSKKYLISIIEPQI